MQTKQSQRRRTEKRQRRQQRQRKDTSRRRRVREHSRQPDASAMAKALRNTLGKDAAEELARQSGFVKRKRKLLPQALVLAVLTTLGLGKVDWLADILRAYNALTPEPMSYKPFHNRLKKPAFERWMMAILELALAQLMFAVIEPERASKLLRFRDLLIHDGTSFGLKVTLKDQYPGRFKKVSPAAVELHVTMSGFENGPLEIAMVADKEAERHFRPDAATFQNALGLLDRAFQDRQYFSDITAAEGSYIVRGTKNIRPTIVEARTAKGRRLRHLEGKRLKWSCLPRESVDLEIVWPQSASDKKPYRGRIVVLYTPGPRNKKHFTYLHTNLQRRDFTIDEVGDLYRFRWQIELMFKEWKSHANLHAFDTGKAPIAEGLIWGSLLAAVVKRSMAHAAELSRRVALSTLRAARSAPQYLTSLACALLNGGLDHLTSAIEETFEFLDMNARRAHPKRDRQRGRFKCGLQPIALS
jgi:hypothetical protein